MQELITFLETLSFDEKLYWNVPDVYGTKTYEIFWNKKQDTKITWKIREKSVGPDSEDKPWYFATSEDVESLANRLKIDLSKFQVQVGMTIMSQAVLANLVLESAAKLFGKEKVSQAIKDASDFMNSLTSMIEKATGSSQSDEPVTEVTSRGGSITLIKGRTLH